MNELYASIKQRMTKPGLDLATNRDIVENLRLAATEPEAVTYAELDAGGVPALWCIPQGSDQDRVLLHSHSGGSVVTSMHTDRKAIGHIAKAVGVRSLVDSLPAGPTGFHPWIDIVVRLGKLTAVTISAIRGRARGAGSELVLASDIRFASRERAVLGQMEVGFGAIPGGGPASWLPRVVGRGRAFEILLGGEDFNGALAERYGYVNRAIPDIKFEGFVDRFVRRVSAFDPQALRDIKHFINKVSLPADEEFLPELDAFWQAAARPAFQGRHSKAFEDGYQQRSEVELRLGEYVGQFAERMDTPRQMRGIHEQA